MRINKVASKKMKEAGVDLYKLPPDEMERWKKLVVPELWNEWIARMEKRGTPVGEFVKKYRTLVEKYEPESKYMLPGF